MQGDQNNMNAETAIKRIEKLREQLNNHNHAYYVEAKPVISDYEYDLLMNELIGLETMFPEFYTDDSASQRVGGEPLKQFAQVTHRVPMLSLDNTYSQEEVRNFYTRIQKLVPTEKMVFSVEPKIDGIAIVLHYEKGQFVYGATRGDGTVGDDITSNLKTIKSIPLRLAGQVPDKLDIRGEVYMSRKGFEKVNALRELCGDEKFANPRNAAAGSLKMLNSKEVAKRHLNAVLYGIDNLEFNSDDDLFQSGELKSHVEAIGLLQKFKFRTPEFFRICHSIDDVIAAIDELDILRSEFPYETDGAVIKVNDILQRELMGVTAKAPRWAIAYKYAAEQAETTVLGITVQVGRTGTCTPVAELAPVFVAGSTIRRATLHNEDEIKRKDVRVHDHVMIQKAGEVIPAVVSVLLEKRDGTQETFNFPQNCPECNTPLNRIEGEAAWFCPNSSGCPAQIRGRLEYFASKSCMDIEGVGGAMVNQLVTAGLVRDPTDIYALQHEQIISLERIGEKSARNLLSSIEVSKEQDLWRLINGLGIENIGISAAKALAKHFGDLNKLRFSKMEELIAIEDFGIIMAESVISYFCDHNNQKLIDRLIDLGVRTTDLNKVGKVVSNTLTSKIFVITGTLSKPREYFSELIENAGGKVSTSVSKKTSFVLAGGDAGSKLDKANELNVSVISEEELLKMLNVQLN